MRPVVDVHAVDAVVPEHCSYSSHSTFKFVAGSIHPTFRFPGPPRSGPGAGNRGSKLSESSPTPQTPNLNIRVTLKPVLNITNGDSAVDLMRTAGVPGKYLPWRDVLHDGPVPGALDLDALSRVRAQFIVSRGWASQDQVEASFTQRDQTLESFRGFDKVILWFEHDLYDQLQILQVLDWFSGQDAGSTTISMICTDQYLGHCTPDQIMALTEFESPVTGSQLELASRAWEAFCQTTPQAWNQLLDRDTGDLPFLHDAVLRQLQEYPDMGTGLSRTAHSSMQLISENKFHPGRLFAEQQATEQRIFMGDLSFWDMLNELVDPEQPLVALTGGKRSFDPRNKADILALTDLGKSVLQGKNNWIDIHHPDKWIGGVHLSKENLWLWDDVSHKVVRR